ncbi:S1C family serine protease [Anoxybacillus sp. LAT_35]|uniref:S1C family serine protease n=1 Tax=unclassified Anoxybacillus TaxID=2639704 RepID=UPI001EDA4736|nr:MULTISPECIES: S1C family serine protease [unclassified Anoxybacillus]MCG5024876.1 S1C family serine protease [Anoxybacillus flavithermus]MCG6198888.1 S1C family serine protease [Anoxybacillus sp. LAT_38]MCG3084941.1 S1C family serine protease [Anoxybacillus sp. LAT27]MCG6171458.1 S1C family serine protease [Anoxybacillus sp. LAT_11]MCG6174667.1 S1C family serine protease [Anoxybacillus sp. LAT_31]
MGYYDDHYEHIRQKQKGNRGGAFLAGVVGAILGGMLVVVTIPSLVKWDVLPYELEQTEEKQVTVTEQPKVDKSVAVDVVTQVTKAVNKVSDAVVGIVNIQEASFWSEGGEAGTGSGVIYKKEGNKAYIVTNHHVVEGASRVEVSLSDGTKVPARLLGSDVWTDLAVLEIDAKHVTNVAEFGDSDVVKVGEPVIAVGNPLGLQFAGSVTQGIISGVNRTIPIDIDQDGIPDWHAEVLQTDAAINPGNSGGALVNIEGQVIGINSMKIAQEAVEGIGLSIPINYAKPIIADLEKFGQVRRPYMGVELRSLSDIPAYHWQQTLHLPVSVKEGVAILQVVPGSPAAQAGLREFDVIVALDDEKIADVVELRKHLYNRKQIGDTMKVTFYRDGKKQTVTLKLAKQSL